MISLLFNPKYWIPSLVFGIAVISTSTLSATAVDPSDFSGSRTKSLLFNPDGGLQANGLIGSLLSYSVSWNITDLGNGSYQYVYNLSNILGLNVTQADFFLELNPGTQLSDLVNLNASSGIINLLLTNATASIITLNGVYGLYIDNISGGLLDSVSFVSTAAPVWGSFANGSLLDLAGNISNVGFTSDPSGSNFTNWIATPGVVATPEPASIILLGSSLASAYWAARRRKEARV